MRVRILCPVMMLCISVSAAFAQSTEFIYQGKLVDGGTAANGNYDFEFRLFGVESGGAALAMQSKAGVPITTGIFTVQLNLGANFNGGPRYLEIAVRPAGGPTFTTLIPRQRITSTPYSIRSLTSSTADTATLASNSQQLGGVNANQFVLSTDARLSDARDPLPNSISYIQNTSSVQSSSNFNISGTGTAKTFDAATQYSIGGVNVLRTSGAFNIFAGFNAGFSNTTGDNNSFFGPQAGAGNTTGNLNSIFGSRAGVFSTGSNNSFFGSGTGQFTFGSDNAFFGIAAGVKNDSGGHNTLVGSHADVSTGTLNYATAIGADSVASQSNSIFLGRPDGSDAVRIPGAVVINGTLVIGSFGSAGSTSICLNASNRVSPCSSSLRYKTSVQSFFGGLDIVSRLRPITFNWIDGGKMDVGFVAEEVNKIEPLLTTLNDKGEIEGVKYAQLTTVLVNAVKEQQTQVENQHKEIDEQKKVIQRQQTQIDSLKRRQADIDTLKRFICSKNPSVAVCGRHSNEK